ncbi:acyl carrier protein [Paenibacillus sp. HN-1]|uniref:acyl carrier protein n=1 Tax=Paenibacillus TaxID=44249 RepID=UPI001CAA0072|nr:MULTISPECIES: acyl carrier protein [Paenibacillus]MBY9077398.1 acyl carrier protein [Paenibacillus sp. CGMCC 1.18879]MBY9087493.1 acyl carrier protein [Paenibacillus sinensis]
MNMKTDVINRLQKILAETLQGDEESFEEISEEDNLLLLGVNSISFVKIVVQCEKEFNIAFDEEELDYSLFENVNKLSQCILEKMGVES